MLDTIFACLYLAGILPTALFWVYYQGYVNRRYAEKKRDTMPPVILGAVTSFVWPLQLLVLGVGALVRSAYSLGEGRGIRTNSVVSEAKELVRQRDQELAQFMALASIGDYEGIRALVSPDDALRAIARHQELDLSQPVLLTKNGQELPTDFEG